jgi:hypothetical protein
VKLKFKYLNKNIKSLLYSNQLQYNQVRKIQSGNSAIDDYIKSSHQLIATLIDENERLMKQHLIDDSNLRMNNKR